MAGRFPAKSLLLLLGRVLRAFFWVLSAAFIGFLCGSRSVNLAPMFFFPILCLRAPSRFVAYLSAAAYYLIISAGIVASAPIYFSLGAGFATLRYLLFLWAGTSLALSVPWCLLWRRPGSAFRSKALGLLAVFVFLALPPLGLWGWANPLLCAGYLLPYTREAGLIVVALVWAGLWHCAEKRRAVFHAAFAVLFVYAAFMSPSKRLEPKTPPDWEGIYTSFGKLYSGSDDTISPYWRHQVLAILLKNSKAKYVVFPETVAGWWGMTTEALWRKETNSFAAQGRTFFVGAETTKRGTKRYYNIVQVRGKNHDTVFQRYPVPISMWRPWDGDGAVADWFGSGIVKVDELSVGVLVCYEPYLFWPCLQTMVFRPDVLVAISNSWWSRITNIPLISDKCVASWALLFDVPMVLSKNI
jgi:hypothetical protein